MKLSTKQLKQMIKEELGNLQNEIEVSNYANSFKLTLSDLENTAKLARQGNEEAMEKLKNAIQIIGSDLEALKLSPNGEHAMFYYKNIGIVDPDVDMDKMYPEKR